MPYSYLPYFSGGQKSIAQFLEYLGKAVDLTVISVEKNEAGLAHTYTLLPILKNKTSRYYDLGLVSKISALVKKDGFDTIIWEHPYYAWLAFRVRKKTGVTTIFHTHNIEYQRFRSLKKWWWPLLKMYEKWCFKKADHIFFIAPEERQFAIDKWHITPTKCHNVPFGIPISEMPRDKALCREKICALHNIKAEDRILLFNGLLNYQPNLDALINILININPYLQQQKEFRYKILVCGKGLPPDMHELKEYQSKNIIYAGFVDDIEMYFKGTDLFLNPVQSGGGIKTKMVEAIAYGTTVISSATGAIGIDKTKCGTKLFVTNDGCWNEFAQTAIQNSFSHTPTPPEYYEYYTWSRIISRIINIR